MGLAEPAGQQWIVRSVLSGALIVSILYGVVWLAGQAMRPYQAVSQSVACRQNVHMMVRGWNLYADDYDARYPPTGRWEMSVEPYVLSRHRRCPVLDHDAGGSGYGADVAACGVERNKLTNEDTTPLVFDCAKIGHNVSATPDHMPVPGRHVARVGKDRRFRRGNWVGYAGGGCRMALDRAAGE